MLVLLITFLLTASSFQDNESSVPLPRVTKMTEIEGQAEVVTLDRQGQIVGFDSGNVEGRLEELSRGSDFTVLAVAVDRDCDYGKLFPVLDAARKAGWKRIVLLTEEKN